MYVTLPQPLPSRLAHNPKQSSMSQHHLLNNPFLSHCSEVARPSSAARSVPGLFFCPLTASCSGPAGRQVLLWLYPVGLWADRPHPSLHQLDFPGHPYAYPSDEF